MWSGSDSIVLTLVEKGTTLSLVFHHQSPLKRKEVRDCCASLEDGQAYTLEVVDPPRVNASFQRDGYLATSCQRPIERCCSHEVTTRLMIKLKLELHLRLNESIANSDDDVFVLNRE